jgi:putative transposase
MGPVGSGVVQARPEELGNGQGPTQGVRTTIPAKDGIRAGDLLNRDFTAPAPDRTRVMDFTYCRTWTGFAYVAFIVDVFAQRIVVWHARDDQGHRSASVSTATTA